MAGAGRLVEFTKGRVAAGSRTAIGARLFCEEREYRGLLQRFSGFDDDRGEVRVVDGVGIMLRFEADRSVLEMIGAVELHGRLRGAHFHDSTAPRFFKTRG